MKKKRKLLLVTLFGLAGLGLVGVFLSRYPIAVLQPAGQIAQNERRLIIFGAALSLVVVVPVFTLLGVFAWKYREGSTKKRKYTPEADGNAWAETIWWLIPTLLIGIISVVTWRSSYALDPFKPISSTRKPLTIQVVALDWKWLFIYPAQHVASVNEVVLPVQTPVDFELTSDTVMNSFWIPSLGGQMYAMPGMKTQLHLLADKTGIYHGSSANISGKGFAGMKFDARAVSAAGFDTWLRQVKSGNGGQLDAAAYARLAAPSQNTPVTYYPQVAAGLYDTIVMKYMMPMPTTTMPNTSLSPTTAPSNAMQGMKL